MAAARTSTADRQKAAAKRAGAETTTALHQYPSLFLVTADITAADIVNSVDGVVNVHVGGNRFMNIEVGDGIALNTDDGWYVGEVTEKTDAQWEQGDDGPVMTEEPRLTLQVV